MVAESIVNTCVPPEPGPGLPWEQVRERMRYRRGVAYDAATEFTFPSPYIPRHDNFVAYARPSFSADRPLMEAAREKEVIVEKAVITVGASQTLFLGEGTRQEYGMIRFDGEPFDVTESYMRLMMEN